MGKILDLPTLERPREKALRFGVSSLSDHELFAIIIGNGSEGNSAIEIAFSMLNDSGGIGGLINNNVSDLRKYKGINKVKAIKIMAVLEIAKRYESRKTLGDSQRVSINEESLICRYRTIIADDNKERLIIVVLNSARKIVYEGTLFMGSENEMPASTKSILSEILAHCGKYFYIIHNHPNNDYQHSEQDKFFVSQLIHDAKILGIRLINSIVITPDGYSLFYKKEGMKIK